MQLETARLIIRTEATVLPAEEELRAGHEAYVLGFDQPNVSYENYRDEITFSCLRAQRDSRFGYYNLFLKEAGTKIGWCNLGPRFCEPPVVAVMAGSQAGALAHSAFEMEIGWAIYKAFRGRGYATEAASALLEYSFGQLNAGRVVAFTAPDNRPSLRVMERLGMDVMAYSGDQGTEMVGWRDNHLPPMAQTLVTKKIDRGT
jgi:RimJ/RimL family protein N-acetyltransferase